MRFLSILIGLLILTACARQGTPTGGPRDETPPRFLNATPDTLSTNVSTDLSEIRIDFDEYLVLKDYTQNIIVSPPLSSTTTFTPVGTPNKSIRIKLNEALAPNTTYNINFGNAIQDHNEGNVLPYFQYVFSTGEYIDSLELNGKVRVPFVREQPKNLMVGLYKIDSTYNDSIILQQKPLYIAKANEKGEFTLNYLKEGKYQLIAFDDEVNNMQYDFGKEKFGFIDEFIDLNERIDGGSSLEDYDDMEKWLLNVELFKREDTVPPGYAIGFEYYFMDRPHNEIVGLINLRPDMSSSKYLEIYGGNIGYSIKPSRRKEGLASLQLKKFLPICKREYGLDSVIITCLDNNTASRKTILGNGGKYINTVFYPPESTNLERYLIEIV